jgi:hypothetical protein
MFRHRLVGAAVLGLAAVLAAAPARAAEVDKLLPNDTETVLTINVKQIFDSALVKKVGLDKAKQALKDQTEVTKILDELGFDPFKDIDTIIIAGSNGTDTDKGLFIVRGKFDVDKFHKKAEEAAKENKDNIEITEVADGLGGKTKLYKVKLPESPNDQPLFIAFASKSVMVASPGKDYVLDALDKEAGKKKTQLKSKELAALLGKVDGKQSVWTTVLGSTLEKSPLPGMDDTVKDIISKIDNAVFGITIDKDLKLELLGNAKTADDAKKLGEMIDDGLNQATTILGLAVGQYKELKPLLKIVKEVKPSVKDKAVSIDISIPGDIITNALEKLNNK